MTGGAALAAGADSATKAAGPGPPAPGSSVESRRLVLGHPLATMRISSISSTGIAARPGGRDSAAPVRSASSDGARQRAPVGNPALDDPERVEALLDRVLRKHEPRRRVGRLEHALESRSSSPPSRSWRRSSAAARSCAARPSLAIRSSSSSISPLAAPARSKCASARRAGAGMHSGRGRPGTATRSAPSARTPTGAGAASACARTGGGDRASELVHQLRRRAAAQRADADRVPEPPAPRPPRALR